LFLFFKIFISLGVLVVDTIGRKVMIVAGLFIFGLSEFLFGFGRSIEILFVSRMLGGVSAAFIMPAVTAYIADITTLAQRPKALGYMSAAISTGFIIGPGIGGFLAEIGTRVPFYAAGVLGLFAAILSFLFLKEPTRATDNEEAAPSMLGSVKRVFSPLYFIPFILIFVLSFGLAAFESLFSLFVDHKFAFTPSDIAIIITGSGIVGALAQLILFDWLTKKMGEINVIRYSLILSAVVTFAMTIVSHFCSVKYGYAIPKVAKVVQTQIRQAIFNMTALETAEVNVHITGIHFEKEETVVHE